MAPPIRGPGSVARAALLGTAFLLFALPAPADMRMTRHSLASRQGGALPADEREVCIFCHTPQVTGSRPGAPRWQESLGTDFAFTLYDDIGRLGFDRTTVGSQSVACLSCHDANQAREVGRTSADHPFGIPYRGARKSAFQPPREEPGRPGDSRHVHARRLVAVDDFRDASQGTIENRRFWWVSASGVTARRTRQDLPLYGRRDAETGEETPHIECGSCHDPHSPNGQFLRVAAGAGALCLTCHSK